MPLDINGFQDRRHTDETGDPRTTCDNATLSMADCVAFLDEKSPDLAAVVEAWPNLSAPVRAGILAMVKADG